MTQIEKAIYDSLTHEEVSAAILRRSLGMGYFYFYNAIDQLVRDGMISRRTETVNNSTYVYLWRNNEL